MNLNKYIYIFFTVMVFSACQKDVDVFIPDAGQINGPDTTWVAAVTDTQTVSLLKKDLQLSSQADSFEISGTTNTLLLPSGLKCEIPSGSLLDAASNPLNGKVSVEAILLKTKGDMIRMNRPTTSGDKLLVSGGAVNIILKNGNQPVLVNQDSSIYISYSAQVNTSIDKLFYGEESLSGFDWKRYTNDIGGYVTATPQEYRIKCRRTGWLSPAMMYESAGPKTMISAKLPPYFTNANTSVYLVFRDMMSVVALQPNPSSRKFVSIEVPTGVPVTLVVISRQGRDYYLGHADATSSLPSSGSQTQSIASNPVKVSVEQINHYLSSL